MDSKGLCVVIVDDDIEDIELLEEAIITHRPFAELYKFTSGHDAIRFIREGTIDPTVIIIDYNMPELNGVDLLRLLINEKKYLAIPKIILSTSSAASHRDECLKNGASNYFVKPNSVEDLKSTALQILSLAEKSGT